MCLTATKLVARVVALVGIAWAITMGGRLGAQDIASADQESNRQVALLAGVLQQRCVTCHGPRKQSGDYRVDTLARLRTPGDSGQLPLTPGDPQHSELFRRVTTENADERMPPEGPPLTADEIELLRTWIEQGTKVDAGIEAAPLISFAFSATKAKTPDHYPSSLPITAIAIDATSADQPRVWTSGYGEILLWQVEPDGSSQLVARQSVSGAHVTSLALSHDRQRLAVASGSPGKQGFVEVFDLGQLPAQPTWSYSYHDLAGDLAFAPNSNLLVIAQIDGSLMLVDLAAIASDSAVSAVRTLTPHADAILGVAWSQDGQRLMTSSRDRTAKIYRAPQLELIANYNRHERAVGGVAFLGSNPVSLDETGQLRLWSGDDSDRTITQTDTRVRFLKCLVTNDETIHLADAGRIRSYTVERKKVDDGQDESGKPKQKTVVSWKSSTTYDSKQAPWLLSLDLDNGWLAAGSEAGHVYLWKHDSEQAAASFTAKP